MKLTIERSGRAEVLMVEGATQSDILPGQFRNFRGEKRKFNDEGKGILTSPSIFPQKH